MVIDALAGERVEDEPRFVSPEDRQRLGQLGVLPLQIALGDAAETVGARGHDQGDCI